MSRTSHCAGVWRQPHLSLHDNAEMCGKITLFAACHVPPSCADYDGFAAISSRGKELVPWERKKMK